MLDLARLLPASARTDHKLVSPTDEIQKFLKKDLMVNKLNKIDKYLWLAGQPMPPKPLNYQIATSREIVVDERIDVHMVWEHSQQQACSRELYKCALGLLSSYMALVQFESDFLIAQNYHLLPNTITWERWLELNQQLLGNDMTSPGHINSRYLFGELRLSRLNKIYAIRHASVLSGYQFTYQTYGDLFYDYLTPLTAATIYVALVLTAMQVGLATDRLGFNPPFQDASYGFTVFAILGPLIGILLIGIIGGLAFVNNLIGSWKFKRQQFALYELSQVRNQLP
ncbi:hypothetical protein PEX1_081900 [Penicillium expansum]|uniref:Uncharacterized protein n=1 Tax=Penicillium expansum TaxID=27334 RepID=A0A0A2IGQ3_PENEN|nr:hypothetical protein PEX2_005300 [Penicillium expansum]KGO39460.1 hypothetical protein PEXP_043010 [Penicillium expansum]KGO50051.1 hypothetical protein PEX1_081900 [Penicillium expansum]KGO55808.1 hypothetical protein PEX2_005300 [Penicillium expansum]